MAGYALARRLQGRGVTVNTVHPGLAATDIAASVASPALRPIIGVAKRLLPTPERAAQGALRLATAPEHATTTGRYFIKLDEARSPDVSYDQELQEEVWKATAALVGLPR